MTPVAIVFLVLSAAMLWGGLVWSLLRLRAHPDIPEEGPPPST